MVDKSAWLKIWGYAEGTPEAEAAWGEKINFRPRRAPMISRDTIDPCRGMDGKMTDSLSALRRTYRADGNPQGENYTEIGNEELKPKEHKFDRAQRRDDIHAAIADVKAGKPIAPPVVLGD